MKKLIASILMFFVCLGVTIKLIAQDLQGDTLKIKYAKTWIKPIEKNKRAFGPVSIYELKDSSITVCKKVMLSENHWSSDCKTFDIPVFYIKDIRIKDKGRAAKGLWKGAAIGFGCGFLGVIIGGYVGQNWAETGLISGCCGAGLGAFYGTLIGAITTMRIPIKGEIGTYKLKKDRIRKYSINK